MQPLRTEEDLQRTRRDLFDTFPKEKCAQEQLVYQECLAQEILRTEQELQMEKSPEYKSHLSAIRTYGDALTWTCLSRYAIRQLARSTGKPPHLSQQGRSFDLVLSYAKAIADQGIPVIVADLTNILKVSDLIVCESPDAPALVECKSSKVREARFERQGRRGRQIARMESIGHFLRTGHGVIFGESMERMTVELTQVSEFNYPTVNQIVLAALHHRPTTLLVSEHELYSAARIGETVGDMTEITRWGELKPEGRIAVGSSLDPLKEAWPDVPPPILWDIESEAAWALMEGDVSITHAVKVEALLGMSHGQTRIQSVIEMPGPFRWGYAVMVESDIFTFSPNILLDVIYAHHTINSAGAQLLELAEKAAALLKSMM